MDFSCRAHSSTWQNFRAYSPLGFNDRRLHCLRWFPIMIVKRRLWTSSTRAASLDCASITSPKCLPSCLVGARRVNALRLYIQVRYEWDEKKNRLNDKTHGISFEVAALVFEDENCLVGLDLIDETGEQ